MADVRRVIEIDVKTSAQAVATMRDIARNAEAMEKRFDSLVSGAKKFGAAMVAEFSVSRIVGAIQQTLEQMDEFGKRAERIGIGTEALSAFTFQAKLAGVTTEQLDVALVKMNKALAGTDEEGSAASKALATLGVTATKPEEAFEQIAEAFSKMESGAKKTALATDIFGKAGAQMIPMLNEGADGIKRAREEAERLGIVMSAETAAAAQAFNDSMSTLQAGIDGARAQMVTGMLPALNQIAEAFKGTTESGERFKSFGEGVGTVINGVTQVLLGFAGVVEVVGRSVAAQFALFDALTSGNFRQARSILADLASDADKIFNDYGARIQKLREAPPIIAPKVDGDVDADDLARKAALAAAAAKQAKLDAKEAEKAEQARFKLVMARHAEAERAAKEISDAVARFTSGTQIGAIENINAQLERLAELESEGAIRVEVAAQARAKLTRELLRQGDAESQLVAELEDEAEASAAVEARREALDRMIMEGTISVEAYTRKIRELETAASESTDKTADKFMELGEAIQRSVEGWSAKTADAILNFAHGVDQSFSKLVTDILGQFERMALQILILDPIFKAFGETLKGMTAGGGGGGGLFDVSAMGNAFAAGGHKLHGFARGGVVGRPTLFKFAGGTGMMGEAGPEAIMPLKRTASGALGVESNGGGGVTVNVVNNAGADVQVEHGRNAATGEQVISVMVERAVADGFARGRFDSLMSSTYGVSRQGR